MTRPFAILLLLPLMGQGCTDRLVERFGGTPVAPSGPPAAITATPTAATAEVARPDIEVIATRLQIPWDIAFLPAGDMLVTERPGRLIGISRNGTVVPIGGLDTDVRQRGEGGLLGIALHPDYATNSFVYLYFTAGTDSTLTCRVVRYKLSGSALTDRTVIVDGIPGAANHDG
ncbi:MAG TPA: PQQ-dependent sugar dehydrogenase, partial [Candidatus Methylomirabilis sp.]|nr:PQQ-dependent sugar dehydrogenase [Candidatus Methylomirabilis sp.]